MNLTICLVTKGRERYLDQILESLSSCLIDEKIQILLIDNGSDNICRDKLIEWKSQNSPATNLVRFETNDARFSAIWPVLLKANVDWIILPGDDDQIRPEILLEWRRAVAADPDLVAFAASSAVMDETGMLTGETICPTAELSSTRVEMMARALHEPAFVWPSLFFRVSAVNPNVPSSRYAADWWVGINLLFAGNIKTTKSIGLNYRVHSSQESNLSPIRRKFFEGSLWIDLLLRSGRFTTWAEELSDQERLLFWRAVNNKKPIYGDEFYARPILYSVARILMDTAKSYETAKEIVGDLALTCGVFLKDNESITLINNEGPSVGENPGNIRVLAADGACPTMIQACKLMKGGLSARVFRVSCTHSAKTAQTININCSTLPAESLNACADLIVSRITSACEANGDFEVALSIGERVSLLMFRSLKNRLPGKVKNYLRNLKNSKKSTSQTP